MNVTELDEFTTNVPVIDDGDTCGNVEHLATAQALANRTKHLRKGIQGLAISLTKRIPLAAMGQEFARFATVTSSVANYWLQTDVTDQGRIRFPIPHSVLGKINKVTAHVAGGSHGALPATLPRLRVVWTDITLTTGAPTNLADVVDPSPSQATYDAKHIIQTGNLAETILSTRDYYVEIRGEAGANSANNQFRILALEVEFTN